MNIHNSKLSEHEKKSKSTKDKEIKQHKTIIWQLLISV